MLKVTFSFHSHSQTFVQSTSLTSISLKFVDWTGSISATRIHQLLTNTSLEESFAAFTSYNAIMLTGTMVTTYKAVTPHKLCRLSLAQRNSTDTF